MNEQEQQLFIEDAKSVLFQYKNSGRNEVARSELVSALRNTNAGGHWFVSESGRGWKMGAFFVNGEMDEILEEGGISVRYVYKGNTVTSTWYSLS